jgi:hypothetical protein
MEFDGRLILHPARRGAGTVWIGIADETCFSGQAQFDRMRHRGSHKHWSQWFDFGTGASFSRSAAKVERILQSKVALAGDRIDLSG